MPSEYDSYLIPRQHFLKKGKKKVLKNWFLFELANAVAEDCIDYFKEFNYRRIARDKVQITELACSAADKIWKFIDEKCGTCADQYPKCPFDLDGEIEDKTPFKTKDTKQDLLVVELANELTPVVESFITQKKILLPKEPDGLIRLIFTLANSTAEMLRACAVCPTKCLQNPNGICYMFDYS